MVLLTTWTLKYCDSSFFGFPRLFAVLYRNILHFGKEWKIVTLERAKLLVFEQEMNSRVGIRQLLPIGDFGLNSEVTRMEVKRTWDCVKKKPFKVIVM